jgi:hypothetical protein
MIDALPLLLSDEGYQISRSVRLRSSASAYFNRTPASASNRRTWTWSGWVKRGKLGSTQILYVGGQDTSNYTNIYLQGTVADAVEVFSTTGGVTAGYYYTISSFRDPSAWYHIVVNCDTTLGGGNRVTIYVNNAAQTLTAPNAFALNADTWINSANPHKIGVNQGAGDYFDGYLTEINFIDGQALTPSSFGSTNATTGVWQPIKYTGTYGTNGFFLNFSDNSAATAAAIGKDYSGNGNNWTPNNISVTAGVTYDSMLDVPTQWADGGNGRGNYATLNPLHQRSSNTLSAANLQFVLAAVSNATVTAGFGLSSGKWYWEVIPTAMTGNAFGAGVVKTSIAAASMSVFVTGGVGYYADTGNKYINGTATAYGASYAINDVIGVALDLGANTITFYKNNVSQGAITIDSGAEWILACSNGTGTGTQTGNVNFGQRPFAYTPPTGFKALNTLNLPTPTILKGNQYFDATLWTGNGTSQTIVNSGAMQPDLVWVKARSLAYSNYVYDSVRGTGTTKSLITDATAAEGAGSANANLTSFDSSGFSLGTTSGINGMNANAGTFVGWQWKEGATQGFDIVTYTGNGGTQNISHNLGVAPSMMIVKSRSTAQRWTVYHISTSNAYIYLNETFAADTANAALRFGNNSAVVQPTSSVFTIGNSVDVNQNTTTYVAYLFAAVAGYSAFGGYTGNGSTDGPFIFTGFRPRWIMWKKTNSATNAPWVIVDTSRSPYNLAREYLLPNASDAETSVDLIDVLSNGFKWRGTAPGGNASGDTYIYAAFSEVGFKYALGR